MPNPVVPVGKIAVIQVVGKDASDVTRPVTGTVTVSDYAAAYVNYKVGGSEIIFVAKAAPTALGSVNTVSVVFHGQASDGSFLPDLTLDFDIPGPPLPPPATHFVVSQNAVRDALGYPVPPDPGSATISIA